MTDAGARDLVDAARARLRSVGAPRECLGEQARSRKILGMGRAPRIVPVGEVWHVGVLLIGDDAVFGVGQVLRARAEAVRGFTAEAQRERAELSASAYRGGFAEGETFHLGWAPIDLAVVDAGGTSGLLSGEGGVPLVRWSVAGAWRPLAEYLREQLDLR